MIRDRRAKIVATVGPASGSPFMLRTLFTKGVDTFRLNFSHGEHAIHAATVDAIRALEREVGVPIGILQDLQGPKIRLGRIVGGQRMLERSEKIALVAEDTTDDLTAIPLPHPEIFDAIAAGHRLFIDDGRVQLTVVAKAPGRIDGSFRDLGHRAGKRSVSRLSTFLSRLSAPNPPGEDAQGSEHRPDVGCPRRVGSRHGLNLRSRQSQLDRQ